MSVTTKPVKAPKPQIQRVEKTKKQRVEYPGLVNGPLTSLPTDFDAKANKPLNRKSFKSEDLLFNWKAQQLRAKADEFDKKAAESKMLGDPTARKNAKKLQRAMATVRLLQESLASEGVDVKSLIENAMKAATNAA